MDEVALRLTQHGSPFEVAEASVEGVPCKVFPKGPQTLNDIYRRAALSPRREYLVSGTYRLTIGETLHRASQLAMALQREFGINVGKQVAILMGNDLNWVIALIAITSLGATAVAIHADLAAETIHALLRNSPTEVALSGIAQAPVVSQVPSIRSLIVSESSTHTSFQSEWVSLMDLLSDDVNSPALLPTYTSKFPPETTALIAFTSGTTGLPKGVMLSHRNLTTGLMNMMLGGALHASRAAATKLRVKPAAGAPSVLMLAPLAHIGGYAQLLLMLHLAGKVVFLSDWQVLEALHLIEQEKIRSIAGATPVMLRELVRACRAGMDVTSLSSFHIHGAALHVSLTGELVQAFPTATVSTGYGLTETCGSICSLAGTELLDRPSSSGMILPSVEIRLMDEQSAEVAPGEIGEIFIRGAMVMQGYWAAPEQTSTVLKEGWFKTRDLGRVDAEGYLYVLDRHQDVLVHHGRQLSSTAIERAAMGIPLVEEAAVLGIMPAAGSEALCVAMVVTDLVKVADNAYEDFAGQLRRQLPGLDMPLTILLCNTFPRTPSGKIERFALKDQLLRATARRAGEAVDSLKLFADVLIIERGVMT